MVVQVQVQITRVINTKITIQIQNHAGRIDGETMMSYVIDWVQDRTHWDRQSLIECGWLETMEVGDLEKVRAKFDTGNGSLKLVPYTQMKF